MNLPWRLLIHRFTCLCLLYAAIKDTSHLPSHLLPFLTSLFVESYVAALSYMLVFVGYVDCCRITTWMRIGSICNTSRKLH